MYMNRSLISYLIINTKEFEDNDLDTAAISLYIHAKIYTSNTGFFVRAYVDFDPFGFNDNMSHSFTCYKGVTKLISEKCDVTKECKCPSKIYKILQNDYEEYNDNIKNEVSMYRKRRINIASFCDHKHIGICSKTMIYTIPRPYWIHHMISRLGELQERALSQFIKATCIEDTLKDIFKGKNMLDISSIISSYTD